MGKRKTTEEYIASARKVHGDRYDYSNTVYEGAKHKIAVICKDHGEFIQRASHHLSGQGCPKCFFDSISATHEEFTKRAIAIHGNIYTYPHPMSGMHTPLNIQCNTCGQHFDITPNNHLRGFGGCPVCLPSRMSEMNMYSVDEFIMAARGVHGKKYDYTKVDYMGATIPVIIICPTHGEFIQVPNYHTSGHGCGKCHFKNSNISQRWLNELGLSDDYNHREVKGLIPNRRYVVDGYDPETNTVYEFHGDYWHGNPQIYKPSDINPTMGKPYGELYQKTLEKKQAFLDAGFKYIEMWESAWNRAYEPPV